MMSILRLIDRILDRGESIIIALLCGIALFLGVMQVVLRYVFNTGFHWNEAVFVTLTIWAMFIGASRAISANLHARVELITEIAPRAVSRVLNVLAILSALALSAIYLAGGYFYVQFVRMMEISDIDTGIPDAITYGIVPVAMTLFVVRYLVKLGVWFADPDEYSRAPTAEHASSGT